MSQRGKSKSTSGCTGQNGGRSDVSLNVLPASQGESVQRRPALRKSRMSKWRAGVLIGIHAIIAMHVAHWLIAGRTVSPVEPSETMYALELGQINAGLIFFALALLSTVVFGRFFCGWGCHLVALQDLCGWAMKKAGVHPKPFRSRLLLLAPLALAIYMFIWPTFKRLVLGPILARLWPEAIPLIGGVPEFPGFSNHLIVDDFWSTFAGPLLAVPFLAICGFATVYLLGAKGYCTYGCPYGGFFAPLDRWSPGRIIVDKNKCEGCGHCTAVCTSNVRVHEEIQDYGMVVDPGCMKCMDCVSVCPNDALSFGFATPPKFAKKTPDAKPRPNRNDLTGGEEVALAGLFLITFVAINGIYGVMPLLFNMGVSACAVFIFWKIWRMFRDPNVRIIGAQLKLRGRIRPAGYGMIASGALLLALVAHSGFVNANRHIGAFLDAGVAVPRSVAMTGQFDRIPEEEKTLARRALGHLKLASSIEHGGVGLAETPGVDLRSAWLHMVLGQLEEAERDLRRGLERQGLTDGLCIDLAQVLKLQGRTSEAVEYCADVLEQRPNFMQTRDMLAGLLFELHRGDEVPGVYLAPLDNTPDDAALRVRLASALESNGRIEEALEHARRAAADLDPDASETRDRIARIFLRLQAPDLVGDLYRRAIESTPSDALLRARYASLLLEAGRASEALDQLTQAVELDEDNPDLRNDLAYAHFVQGDIDAARQQLLRAARIDPAGAGEHYARIGEMYRQAGDESSAAFWFGRARDSGVSRVGPGAGDRGVDAGGSGVGGHRH